VDGDNVGNKSCSAAGITQLANGKEGYIDKGWEEVGGASSGGKIGKLKIDLMSRNHEGMVG
jgi:hypothetical protein